MAQLTPLAKRFRYRDQSGASLEAHTAHWRGFTWQAGPVVVIHKGGPWGVPQVWAATAEEGKRVIRHAGLIAGVDPDRVGSWVVRTVTDPRYGRTGTMAPRQLPFGAIAVTKRPGPSGHPEVALSDP